ncbi:hypothetical protein [Adlercreutzia sp. ZJ304]|uniref:hypothetical protein n=1 Tax=Adlercreutzia sp. ZJ304 TaxID=2709791 RepID=UPI0013EB9D98|nr:hypothetical protein [Adlercreutzia sp. ZJ304]
MKSVEMQQVIIRVEPDMYRRFKAALQAGEPRQNTTQAVRAFMWDVIHDYEEKLEKERSDKNSKEQVVD